MTRIQIAVYDVLQVEAVVENRWEADRLWAAWCRNRYDRNLPMGGAIICSAEIPRKWNIPVGSSISSK